MINISLLEFKWSVELGQSQDGQQTIARLHMQDDDSKIVTSATFAGEALETLTLGFVDAMSDEQKNALLAKLTSETTGIIIPGNGNGGFRTPPVDLT